MAGLTNFLQRNALELRRLNLLIVKAVADGDCARLGEVIAKYIDTSKQIKLQLIENPIPIIHDKEAKDTLRNISEGIKHPADKIIAALEGFADVQVSLTEFDDSEINGLASDLFYSWFSHYDYICGLLDIGSLIVSISLPDNLKVYVDEAKSCYAFQQYNAVFAICRIILESSVRDICLRLELIRFKENGKYPWSILKEAAAQSPLREQIGEIYDDLCALIHGRKIVSSKDAITAFRSTLAVVHDLYDYHNL